MSTSNISKSRCASTFSLAECNHKHASTQTHTAFPTKNTHRFFSHESGSLKLHEFFVGQDTELIFGSPLTPDDFNDNNVGKVLDNIHSYGASKLFSQVSWQACQRYDLDSRFLHYDTTSVNVYGDYAAYAQATENTVAITHGHSKDKRAKKGQVKDC